MPRAASSTAASPSKPRKSESDGASPNKRPRKSKEASTPDKGATESDSAYLLRVGDAAGREASLQAVSARGLPAGCLAHDADTGFAVRSLDGILPLPSHETIALAMRKLAAGEDRAAAAAARHPDHDSIRAFCAAWHTAWRLPVPPSLSGGGAIDAAAQQRIDAAAATGARCAQLRGRLVLVSAGEDGSGEACVDPARVGEIFEGGEALRAATGCGLATFALTASAEKAWAGTPVARPPVDSRSRGHRLKTNHRSRSWQMGRPPGSGYRRRAPRQRRAPWCGCAGRRAARCA